MAGFISHARLIIGALALAFVFAVSAPVAAQQPSSVNPNAQAVSEDQLLNALQNSGGTISGRVTIPDKRSATLIQPAGQDWRSFHERTLKWIGGISVIGMIVLLVAFYLFRGMVKIERGRSGRTVVRFNAFERFVHWMTAACFIILAISGPQHHLRQVVATAADGA